MEVVNVRVKYLRPKYNSLKEWMKDENHVYIGRNNPWVGVKRSKWHNPYTVKQHTREKVVELYEKYVLEKIEKGELDLDEIRGKVLGCWCKPNDCHGDILVRLCKEV